jgi:hypothetical protein
MDSLAATLAPSPARPGGPSASVLLVVDPDLARRLARGEYVVDPSAVAEAILRRARRRAAARRLSAMLEAAEGDRGSGGVQEDGGVADDDRPDPDDRRSG